MDYPFAGTRWGSLEAAYPIRCGAGLGNYDRSVRALRIPKGGYALIDSCCAYSHSRVGLQDHAVVGDSGSDGTGEDYEQPVFFSSGKHGTNGSGSETFRLRG